MKEKFISFVLNRPLFIIFLTALLAFSAFYYLPKIKIDNSVDVFFDRKSKSYIDFQEWKEQFGSDQIIIVAFKDTNIFTEENLGLISRLTEKFESLEYVDTVTSLTNVNDIVGYENDFIVRPLVEEIPSTFEDFKELKAQALNNPLYVKNVVSGDAKTTAIILELEHNPVSDDIYKKKVVKNVFEILKENFPKQKKYYVSGFTAIEYFYALYMQDDLKTFMPFIFIMIIGVLYLSFRRWKTIILPLIAIVASTTFTMVFLYFCGFSINNVTTIIPPILMAIAVADSIHLITESIQRKKNRQENIANKDSFLSGTMKHLLFPCFLTTVTTAAGFLSLTVSRIRPVKELGLVAGAGVFFAFIITFTFLPALAKKFGLLDADGRRLGKRKWIDADFRESSAKGGSAFGGNADTRISNKFDSLLRGIAVFNKRYKVLILVGTAILIGFSVWGISRIKVETSVLEYFKKSTPIYASTMFIEDNLSGVHSLNISLKAKTQDYFKNPEVLSEIEKLQEFLYSLPEVDKVTSVLDYIKEINKSFHNETPEFYAIPSSKKLIAQYLLLYGATDLDDFVDSQWRWATVRIRLKEHSTARLKTVMKEITDYLRGNFAPSVQAGLIGQTVLEVETNNAVTRGQIQSLALAMLIIFGMMFIVFKSIPLGLISLAPNMLPILVNFGIMGWLGIRLDSATSMISAIGIGIIVDDTIHFLHAFGESYKETGDYTNAMFKTFQLKGRPIILTSVILFFGFSVVMFSKFVPTYYFGLLCALLMFNALWADLIVLPCILLVVKPKFK